MIDKNSCIKHCIDKWGIRIDFFIIFFIKWRWKSKSMMKYFFIMKILISCLRKLWFSTISLGRWSNHHLFKHFLSVSSFIFISFVTPFFLLLAVISQIIMSWFYCCIVFIFFIVIINMLLFYFMLWTKLILLILRIILYLSLFSV